MKTSLLSTLILLGILLLPFVLPSYATAFVPDTVGRDTLSIENPNNSIDNNIWTRVENASTDQKASVGLAAGVWDYLQLSGNTVRLNMSMDANSRYGLMYDLNFNPTGKSWIDPSDPSLWYKKTLTGSYDDYIYAVDMNAQGTGFGVQFYSGFYSQYTTAFISTNGFVSFDNRTTPSPTPTSLPNTAAPKAMVAAVWTDLYMNSASSIITGTYISGLTSAFVIIWINMLHKGDNVPLTFEIQLWAAQNQAKWYAQSNIEIVYHGVSSINAPFSWGIQNQYGVNGTGSLVSGGNLGSFNGQVREFSQLMENSYFLENLKFTLQNSNSNDYFVEDKDYPKPGGGVIQGYYLKGYGLQASSPTTWLDVLEETSFCIGTFALGLDAWNFAAALYEGTLTAGQIGGFLLGVYGYVEPIAVNWGKSMDAFSQQQSYPMAIGFSGSNPRVASCNTYDYVVDASMDISGQWHVPDPSANHTMIITATATYGVYNAGSGKTSDQSVSTSVKVLLAPGTNTSPGTAYPIYNKAWTYDWQHIGGTDTADYYNVTVTSGDIIEIYETTEPGSSGSTFISLTDPGNTVRWNDGGNHAASHYTKYTASVGGTWLINVSQYSYDYEFYSLGVNALAAKHNVLITNVVLSKTVIGQGYNMIATVTASNTGNVPETFAVDLYANGTTIGSTIVSNLASGANTQLNFVWNTAGVPYGFYIISAHASQVQGEVKTDDNTFNAGKVTVTIPGDINGDFTVGLSDLVLLGNAYGSTPGTPNWNPNADIDGNGIVGLSDQVILANHYGQHYP